MSRCRQLGSKTRFGLRLSIVRTQVEDRASVEDRVYVEDRVSEGQTRREGGRSRRSQLTVCIFLRSRIVNLLLQLHDIDPPSHVRCHDVANYRVKHNLS